MSLCVYRGGYYNFHNYVMTIVVGKEVNKSV